MASLGFLSATVAAKSQEVLQLLAANGLNEPTFSENSHEDFKNDDPQLRKARNELVSAAQDIVRLARGPDDHILNLAWSSADTSNLAVILRFNVAQNVPFNKSISATDLAKAVNLPEDTLTRTIRYAIGNGIFHEPTAGVFGHTASSAALAHNEHLRNIALTSTHELSYILLKLAEALSQQQKKGKDGPVAAFNIEYPQYSNVFEFLSKDPESASRYHNYMVGRVMTSRWGLGHLQTAWDWASVGSKTIIDCGGSSGHTCLALGPVAPEAKFIIQDIDPVALEQGRATVGKAPHLAGRVQFVQHDFFLPQSTNADIYMFRHIFHDWSDEDTIKILKNLVPALKEGNRVLVSEGIVREPPATTANTLDKKQILVEDMFMLSVHGAKERSISDFVALFKQADAKFEYVGTTGGQEGAFQSLVDFVYKP